jgi:hypothetical protein
MAGVSILTSDNVHFKVKLVKRDKDDHFILIKWAIHQEKIIITLYETNVSTPEFIKHTLKDLNSIDPNTVVVGDFNPSIEKSSRQTIYTEILELNDMDIYLFIWMEITDVYRETDVPWETDVSWESTIYIILSSPWKFL